MQSLEMLDVKRTELSLSSGHWTDCYRDTAVASNTNNRAEVTVRQTRAAIFLIFLLGINFLLLPFRPESGSSVEYFYDILSTISSSFQGTLRSI